LLLPAALCGLALGWAAPAEAGWSPAVPVPGSASWPAIAVNGGGQVALAWADEPMGARRSFVLRAAVGRPAAGGLKTHTLLRATDRRVADVTVTVDRFGEVSVAWVEQPFAGGRAKGSSSVRAAYRTRAGRWSRVQLVGRSSAFINVAPRVGSAPDGTVALSYYSGTAQPRRMALAWRAAGRPFTAARSLGGDFLTDPTLLFDAGTMYLAGTSRCDGRSQAVLYRAAPTRRRQPDAFVVGGPPVRRVGLGLTGDGAAVVAWIAGGCSGEDTFGLPTGAAVKGTKVGSAQRLDASPASDLIVAGSDVSWVTSSNKVLTTRLIAGKPAPAAQAPRDGWVPVAVDASGDQLVRQVNPASAIRDPAAAMPAGAGSLLAAPLPLSGWPWNAGTAGAPLGQGLAMFTVSTINGAPALVASSWRP